MPGKFNKTGTHTRKRGTGPVRSETVSSGRTHQGGTGYAREAKGELFTLAVTHLGEDTFYEPAKIRDSRLVSLVHQVAAADDGPQWLTEFAGWLRREGGMRRAPILIAAEGVRALTAAGRPGGRQLVAASLNRSDEPGELVSYWDTVYGGTLPWPIKRGIADVLPRLYTEYTALKYDTPGHPFRFSDVMELTHAPLSPGLARYLLAKRHGRTDEEAPRMARNQREVRRRILDGETGLLARPDVLREVGFTWEDALSLTEGKISKAKAWEAVIPQMGYQALLMNLRNFDQAGISDAARVSVSGRLSDPEQVAKSGLFPLRFLAAYRAVPSEYWSWPLELAMGYATSAIPQLDGSTLILVDTSRSMQDKLSERGTLLRWDAAVQFALALAARCEQPSVVSFSGRGWYHEARVAVTKAFPLIRSESLIKGIARWNAGGFFLGAGTDTALALRKHYAGHKRVVVLTDEQAGEDPQEVSQSVPEKTPMYTWNLAGYKMGHAPSGPYRHVLAGLTDAGFRIIPWLERGKNAPWPWEKVALAAPVRQD